MSATCGKPKSPVVSPPEPMVQGRLYCIGTCGGCLISFDSTRRRLRAQRDDLPKGEAVNLSNAICQHILASPVYLQAHSIAAYWAIGRECALLDVINHAVSVGKRLYLPFVQGKTLEFVRWTDATLMQSKDFGIMEPVTGDSIQTGDLELVLAPLLGFDQHGTRVGMGGGYYDRAFSSLAKFQRPADLKLVGVAYEFQRAELPDPRPWDIALDAVVTELGWQAISTGVTHH